VQAYFDVGNIVIFGYPEQWIRILGKRIKKVHVKGFNADERRFTYLIEDCTIDWNAVMTALNEVGYDGYMTAELPVNRDDPEGTVYNISKDMDKIIAGM
jgi:hexulose-6-phosphate isomerase